MAAPLPTQAPVAPASLVEVGEPITVAPAGREGFVALAQLIEDGAFGSHEQFDDVQRNETIGDEPEPGSGFEHGRVTKSRR